MSIEKPYQPSPEEQKDASKIRELTQDNENKIQTLFKAIERGGGNIEVQEARLRLNDLKEKLEMFKKNSRTYNDAETIKWYEREIALNQRVVNGEKLVDVLNSMQTEEDKKRIEETRDRLKNMKQL